MRTISPSAVQAAGGVGAASGTLRAGRFAATSTTYGPLGRSLATLLLVAPDLWCLAHPGSVWLGFAGIWSIAILPKALREVWRRN